MKGLLEDRERRTCEDGLVKTMVPFVAGDDGESVTVYCIRPDGRSDAAELRRALEDFMADYGSSRVITGEPMTVMVECADEDSADVVAEAFGDSDSFTVLIVEKE